MRLTEILRQIGSVVVARLTLRGRLVAPDDDWLLNEVETLYRTCRFDSKTDAFTLTPEVFDSIGDYRAQVAFLAKRHGLAKTDITVYMHGQLKRGSRRCAGLAQYPFCFETSDLRAEERLLSVNSDGTYSVIDSTDTERPTIRLTRTPISLSPRAAAVFIDQAFINRRAGLAGIIAHEVAHLYLYDRGVHKPTVSDLPLVDEYRTDIAMFVMGLGLLAVRAAATSVDTQNRP